MQDSEDNENAILRGKWWSWRWNVRWCWMDGCKWFTV